MQRRREASAWRERPMKYVKMLGLAVLAASLMALAGAGTASGSVLCKTNVEKNCGAVWHWPKGTAIQAKSEAKIGWVTKANGEVATECESTISFTTQNTGSAVETVQAAMAAGG